MSDMVNEIHPDHSNIRFGLELEQGHSMIISLEHLAMNASSLWCIANNN